jgi:hypothetical protein
VAGGILAFGESEERVAKTNHLGALAIGEGALAAVGLLVLIGWWLRCGVRRLPSPARQPFRASTDMT